MATKTISLTEEAYERLKGCKREGESFSDVVNRITGGDRDVWAGFGVYDGEDAEAFRDEVSELRDEDDRDLEERGEEVARKLEGFTEGE